MLTKPIVFEGAATALITPMAGGRVDYASFGALIDAQIEAGIDALVVCGTTGESSTLTDEEHRECIRFCVERTAGRVPVIAGTGSNDTAYAIELTRAACEYGADAVLLVTPYYNKATPKGLVASFAAIADASIKPVILYNVPSRTGCALTVPVCRELAKHERIVAVKEASGNISFTAELAATCGDSLAIYSGNDDQILPILSLGGRGVISVLSNVAPAETAAMCRMWREGDVAGAVAEQLRLLPLVNALFCEVNPVPVKAAMAMMGACREEYRLPLCSPEESSRARIRAELERAGLL